MCEDNLNRQKEMENAKTIPVEEAVGMVLAHDITEIRTEFKGRAFRKGHIIRDEDISHLQRLGKENLFVLDLKEGEMHEDDAARALAKALMGKGVQIEAEPHEGKINIIAAMDGLLRINVPALTEFNVLGEVMCATLHTNTVVKKGQLIAATRAIPLVVRKSVIAGACRIAEQAGGLVEVRAVRKPKTGVVITGNEVYYGRIKDAFAPVITKKIKAFDGEIVGIYYAPDNESFIEARLRELISAGADLLITTGGMSVDPDDVTRTAIRNLASGSEVTYGSAALPGSMFLAAHFDTGEDGREKIPILGIPACGMYNKTTVFDLVLPRVLSGEHIGRKELASLGHGGLCLQCEVCRYPVCPFGK